MVTNSLSTCPRCNKRMVTVDEFPNCVSCGYVDYSAKSTILGISSSNVFRGNIHLIRYKGSIEKFKNISLKIEISYSDRGGHETICENLRVIAVCPFCDKQMCVSRRKKKNSIVIQKKFNKTIFYHLACINRHTVWLSMDANASWH